MPILFVATVDRYECTSVAFAWLETSDGVAFERGFRTEIRIR